MDLAAPASEPAVGQITLRYWAAIRSVAGVDEDVINVAEPVTLAWLLGRADALHRDSSRFRDVLKTCSVMLGDRPVSTEDPEKVLVPPGSTIQLLPPFAGG